MLPVLPPLVLIPFVSREAVRLDVDVDVDVDGGGGGDDGGNGDSDGGGDDGGDGDSDGDGGGANSERSSAYFSCARLPNSIKRKVVGSMRHAVEVLILPPFSNIMTDMDSCDGATARP